MKIVHIHKDKLYIQIGDIKYNYTCFSYDDSQLVIRYRGDKIYIDLGYDHKIYDQKGKLLFFNNLNQSEIEKVSNDRIIEDLLAKIKERIDSGKSCLKMIIKGKTFYFPFSGIEKPTMARIENGKAYTKEYSKYLEKKQEFILLKEYYERTMTSDKSPKVPGKKMI